MITVQPYIRIHVNAIKMDSNMLVLLSFFCQEFLSIPTRTANGKTGKYATGTCLIERTNDTIGCLVGQVFDAPIVWQVKLSPFCIIVTRLLCIGNGVFYKKPIIIKRPTAGGNNR